MNLLNVNLVDKSFINRSLIGFLLLFTILCAYLLKFDLIFFSILSFLIFIEIYKNKFLNNFLFILLILGYLISIFFTIQSNIFLYIIILLSILCLSLSFVLKNFINILFPYFILFFLCIFFSILTNDREIFYMIIFISFINDTSAYFFGNLIKGPKISKKISPNKTWSGTLISIFISSSFLFYFNFNLINSIIISILFFYGDLYFSYIKRLFYIKDFSSILSSHGGVLDRIDSITISTMFIFLLNLSYV